MGHGVGQAVDPHFDPHLKVHFYNEKHPKSEDFRCFLSCVDKKDVHSRVFQRSSQAAKPQKAGSDQSRGEYACKRTGGGSAALRREGEAKQTLLQRGRSVIKGFVKIQ